MTEYDQLLKTYRSDHEEIEETVAHLYKLAMADGVFDLVEKWMILDLIKRYAPHHTFHEGLFAQSRKKFNARVIHHPRHMLVYMIMLAYCDGKLSGEEWQQIQETAHILSMDDAYLDTLHSIVKHKIYNTILRQVYAIKINSNARARFLSDVREVFNLPRDAAAYEESVVRDGLTKGR
ncbi:MAG: hypothetical protein ACMUJM_16215 [bacterium]